MDDELIKGISMSLTSFEGEVGEENQFGRVGGQGSGVDLEREGHSDGGGEGNRGESKGMER